MHSTNRDGIEKEVSEDTSCEGEESEVEGRSDKEDLRKQEIGGQESKDEAKHEDLMDEKIKMRCQRKGMTKETRKKTNILYLAKERRFLYLGKKRHQLEGRCVPLSRSPGRLRRPCKIRVL